MYVVYRIVLVAIILSLVKRSIYCEYNRQEALEYAAIYCSKCNHSCCGYDKCCPWSWWGGPECCGYAAHNGNCANFVSQCLLAGGHPELKIAPCRGYPCGKEEIGAARLGQCLRKNFGWEDLGCGYLKPPPAKIKPGDFLLYGKGCGDWDGTHATIVTYVNGDDVRVSANSSFQCNRSYKYLTDSAHAYYWWIHYPDDIQPVNNAAVVSFVVPSTMTVGSAASVSIRVKNVGNTTWSESDKYRLGAAAVSVGGVTYSNEFIWTNFSSGGYSRGVSDQRCFIATGVNVPPNGEYTFSFSIIAPENPGKRHLVARMVQDSVGWFGEALRVGIDIIQPSTAPPPVVDTAPPSNPTECSAWVNDDKTVSIQSDVWQGLTNRPYFEWSGAWDDLSGVCCYSVYFGAAIDMDPGKVEMPGVNVIINHSTPAVSYQPSVSVPSGGIYYLRVRTKDMSNNWSEPTTLFIVKYRSYESSSSVVADISGPVAVGMRSNDIEIFSNVTSSGNIGISGVKLEYKLITEDGVEKNFCKSDMIFDNERKLWYGKIVGKEVITEDIAKIEYRCVVNFGDSSELGVVTDWRSIVVLPYTQKSISISGGEVKVEDGNSKDGETTLYIPPNAIDDTIIVRIREYDSSKLPPNNSEIVLPTYRYPLMSYEVNIEGGTSGRLTFKEPVVLKLLYLDNIPPIGYVDGTKAVKEESLGVFWYDDVIGEWRYIGGTVDRDNNVIICKVSHLSIFGIFAIREDREGLHNGELYRPKEKIITPNNDGKNDFVHFSGIGNYYQNLKMSPEASVLSDEEFSVRIYDLSGKLIRKLHDSEEVWDGRDDNGNIVDSGIYIYQYKINGKQYSGTIAVAR